MLIDNESAVAFGKKICPQMKGRNPKNGGPLAAQLVDIYIDFHEIFIGLSDDLAAIPIRQAAGTGIRHRHAIGPTGNSRRGGHKGAILKSSRDARVLAGIE